MSGAFTYRDDFEPVPLSATLWSLQAERRPEFRALRAVMEESPEDFRSLCSAAAAEVPESSRGDPATFLSYCSGSGLDVGWLAGMVFRSVKDDHSALPALMHSLLSSHRPITIVQDLPKELEMELGDSQTVSLSAVGNPPPAYHWYMLGEEDDGFRHLPEITSDSLEFTDFSEEDCGTYQCKVVHSLRVERGGGGGGESAEGPSSRRMTVRARKGSLWVRRGPGPPRLEVDHGGSFELQMEVLSEASCGPVRYQWLRDGAALTTELGPVLSVARADQGSEGTYTCRASNSFQSKSSPPCFVSVRVPSAEDLESGRLKFTNREILILRQPCRKGTGRRAAAGEVISLECLAVCRYPLRFEWLRQGFKVDLAASDSPISSAPAPKVPCTEVEMVSAGMTLQDMPERLGVSLWRYHCVVRCPRTGERVESAKVDVPVSTYLAGEAALPRSKMALVVCQEEYQQEDDFKRLSGPRNDGGALVRKLEEMGFDVLAFVNLSFRELQNAIELFVSLVEKESYALFYFNGHAVGVGEDTYLACTDTDLSSPTYGGLRLLWHCEVEDRLASAAATSPLMGVAVFDCCRDRPPPAAAALLHAESAAAGGRPRRRHPSFTNCFGTRAESSSYEFTTRNSSEGLYMRHLLRHLDSPGASVTAVLERAKESFTRDVDQSIASRMAPELKSSNSQPFCLSSPLRLNSSPANRREFFLLTRAEAQGTTVDQEGGCFRARLNVVRSGNAGFAWSRESSQGALRVLLRPGIFLNEFALEVHFGWKEEGFPEEEEVFFQVLGVNVDLVQRVPAPPSDDASHPLVKRFHAFQPNLPGVVSLSDGPVFRSSSSSSGGEGLIRGTCEMKDLQKVSDLAGPGGARLRVLMHCRGKISESPGGELSFPLPILVRFPGLKRRSEGAS